MAKKYKTQKLTIHQKHSLVSKLEPLLKSGLSIRQACLESGVSRATLYRIMEEDEAVRDQIQRFQNYLSVMVTWMTIRHLLFVKSKQDQGIPLGWEDIKFVAWFATHSRSCSEEFGKIALSSGKINSAIDPYLERRKLRQMIESSGGVCS
jgi:hypothetical protein